MIVAYGNTPGPQPLADHIMDACEEWGIPPWEFETAEHWEWLERYKIRKKCRNERIANG